MAPLGHRRGAHRHDRRARELPPHSLTQVSFPCRPPSSDTASGGHPRLAGTPRHTRGAPQKPEEGAGRIGHLGAAARTLARFRTSNPVQDLNPLRRYPEHLHYAKAPGQTHLDKIKAGQEGDAVLDHFALWPLLRRHPGRLPGSASSPGRSVHSAAEASSLLQPQAPVAADVTFSAGTSGASALRAAPPPLPAPFCSNPASLRARKSCSSPTLVPLPDFLCAEMSSSLPSSKLLLQWLPLPATLPLLSTAPTRLQGCRNLTSRIGKGGRTPDSAAVNLRS